MKDYYHILGIRPTATQEDIKNAFRRLAVKYHPDVSKEPDCAAKFSQINEAYSCLSDEAIRATYDIRRSVPGQMASGQSFGQGDTLYEMLRRHQAAAKQRFQGFGGTSADWHERKRFWEQEKQEARDYAERRERTYRRMRQSQSVRIAKVLASQWPAQTSITRHDVVAGTVFAAGCAAIVSFWMNGRPDTDKITTGKAAVA